MLTPLENRAALLSVVCDALKKHTEICGDCTGENPCQCVQNIVAEMMAKNVGVETHGHWKFHWRENFVLCSECGDEHYIGTYHQFAKNCCPNCMAIMDGKPEYEEDDEND